MLIAQHVHRSAGGQTAGAGPSEPPTSYTGLGIVNQVLGINLLVVKFHCRQLMGQASLGLMLPFH